MRRPCLQARPLASLWFMLASLALVGTASGQTSWPVGWVFSRANCVNNESITWLATVRVHPHLIVTPKGVPARRMTASTHYDRLNRVSHTVRTGDDLELTWRSAAIHWLEGLPTYVGSRWVLRLVRKWVIVIRDGRLRLVRTYRLVRVRVRVYVTDRWIVYGDHWENPGNGLTHRETQATDCNWDGTFDK